MHIQSCENPQRVYNKYLKDYIFAPCGKCDTCLSKRAQRWVQRLNLESQCHRYCVFFTLTYSDDNVPYMQFSNDAFVAFEGSHDLCITYDELPKLDVLSKRLLDKYDKIPVLSSYDFQCFIKRFRSQIHEKFKKTPNIPSIRYFIAGEYGPTTFRPHGHGIMWFDDKRLSDCFDELFIKSWSKYNRLTRTYEPLGFVDWSYVEASAASYVASYVNCSAHLPKLLTAAKICPFSLCSRRPPIGSLLQSSEGIRKIFDNGLVGTYIRQRPNEAPVFTPLIPSIKNRLFPKIARYSSLSSDLRVSIYGIGSEFFGKEDCESLEGWQLYVRQHFKRWLCYKDYFDILSYFREISDGWVDWKPIYRVIHISQRVISQAAVFGVSVRYYVSRIELFYKNLDYHNLKSWFEFCEDYSRQFPQTDLVFTDLEFVDRFYHTPSKINPLIIESYGLSSFISFSDLMDLEDFRRMVFKSYTIMVNTTKTKKKNDYLLAHPEKSLF